MKHKYQNDSVKPGMGIDGDKGEDFTKHSSDPWSPPELTDGISDGKGKYTSNDVSFLNHKDGDPTRENPWGKKRDIYDEVWDQNTDDSNRAIKSRGGQS